MLGMAILEALSVPTEDPIARWTPSEEPKGSRNVPSVAGELAQEQVQLAHLKRFRRFQTLRASDGRHGLLHLRRKPCPEGLRCIS